MGPDSKGKKKPYLSPILKKLTLERAKKFVADRTDRNDQEAAEFLKSLRQGWPQKEEKHPPNDAAEKKRQRSA
jgi:hypothetical protein